MDTLLGKLTNLSYDFFGVFLPGFLGLVLTALILVALGPVVPTWTASLIQEVNLVDVFVTGSVFDMFSTYTLVFSFLVASYVMGQVVLWRSRKGDERLLEDEPIPRMKPYLKLQSPKLEGNYHPSLEALFEQVSIKFGSDDQLLEWRQFYPVAKSYLAQNLKYSLIATYQNKYTLHRTLAMGGALAAYLVVALCLLCLITSLFFGSPHPHWLGLVSLALLSLLITWDFSSSYLYYWTLFGDTIVTETYALLFGPDLQRKA